MLDAAITRAASASPGPTASPAAPRRAGPFAPLRVLHVVTGLGRGGAEGMLARLAAEMRGTTVQTVVSLSGGGPVAAALRSAGADVHAVDLRSAAALPGALARLAALVRRADPDVVHCWMYHANLIGGLVARAVSRAPVVWGLRSGSPAADIVGRRTARIARAGARLSARLPVRIVCPSAAVAAAHIEHGYAPERIAIVPNGFDTAQFRPSPALRAAARAALGVAPHELLVGIVANVTPVKDHARFVAAAALLVREVPAVRFLLCGAGASPGDAELPRRIAAAGIGERCLLLGSRERVWELLPALDLFTLCSRREGFPNALGEAMACAVPAVATAVGGVPELAGSTVRLVSGGMPRDLADAWREVLLATPRERAALGRAARRRIVDHFSIQAAAARHAELYAALARPALARAATGAA